MVKTTNHTTKNNKQAKELSWYEQYKNINSWRKIPVSDKFIEKLCEEMIKHFDDQKNICFIKFLSNKGIVFRNFLNWTEKHENLEVVYNMVMQKIGSAREDLAIDKDKNCNPGSIIPTLRHYHPMWKKSYDEESDLKLKQTDKGSNETKVVIIEKFPEVKNGK